MADNVAAKSYGDSTVARLVCDPALGAGRRSVDAGFRLHEPGTPAEHVFLIQKGQVRLYQLAPDGSRRLLEILGPGEWFGAEAVGGLDHYGCQARAQTPVTVCIIPAGKLLAALAQRPEASLELIRQLAGKLNTATEDAGQLAFDDCRRRLVKTLLKFSHSAAATANGNGVELHMTHEQLGQAVGAARETVSLVINQLRRQKIIRTGRNRLLFDPSALTQALAAVQPSRSSTIFS
jgi:CRP/FNR family transcriptional regulator